jgi:DNA-binding NarL/FixJ family response regulator
MEVVSLPLCVHRGVVPSISVLVVDDHAVFADALRASLSAEVDLEPVNVAYGVAEASAKLKSLRPDIAVLDLRLGDGDGLALADRIPELSPATKVMMLSAVESVEAVVEALAVGVRTWLPKTIDTRELVRAIRAVHMGDAWLDPALFGSVLSALTKRAVTPLPNALTVLTPREREVLDCLANGLSRADIAAKLQVSVNTVRSHVHSLIAKLGVHSTLEAAALRNRLRVSR